MAAGFIYFPSFYFKVFIKLNNVAMSEGGFRTSAMYEIEHFMKIING